MCRLRGCCIVRHSAHVCASLGGSELQWDRTLHAIEHVRNWRFLLRRSSLAGCCQGPATLDDMIVPRACPKCASGVRFDCVLNVGFSAKCMIGEDGYGKEIQVTGKLPKNCSPPPSIPASSAIARRLSRSCPMIGEKLLRQLNSGPNSTRIGRVRPPFDRFVPTLAQLRPTLTKLGWFGPKLERVWKLADSGPTFVGVGQLRPKLGQLWANSAPGIYISSAQTSRPNTSSARTSRPRSWSMCVCLATPWPKTSAERLGPSLGSRGSTVRHTFRSTSLCV